MLRYILSILLTIIFLSSGFASKISIEPDWKIQSGEFHDSFLTFSEASDIGGVPGYSQYFPNKIIDFAFLEEVEFQELSAEELGHVKLHNVTNEDFELKTHLNRDKGQLNSTLTIKAIRYNPQSKKYEKILRADIVLVEAINHSMANNGRNAASSRTFESVLSSGDWYKLAIVNSGAYILNYNYLTAIDAAFAGAPLNSIKLFGNGGDMLPEINTDPRVDDLQENPMMAVDINGNGNFDAGDYFLFYGDATDSWSLAEGRFSRQENHYSDTSFYFVTKSGNDALRMQTLNTPAVNAQETFLNFDERIQYELDAVNLIKSGREWYGELFDFELSRSFSFNIPNLVSSQEMCIDVNLAAISVGGTSAPKSFYTATINGNQIGTAEFANVSGNYGKKADSKTVGDCMTPGNLGITDNFNVLIQYNKNGNQGAKAYLNYINIQAKRSLEVLNKQLTFRNLNSAGAGTYSYQLSGNITDLIVWDVTDPIAASRINANTSGNSSTIKVESLDDEIKEYLAFNVGMTTNPRYVGKVENQNLHGHEPKELIVITSPQLLPEAERFVEYKRSKRLLEVELVTVPQIYNEFSSGKQDLSAIRDYLKMLYDRGEELENVLLFGDCSYDYKDRIAGNTNHIPVFESKNSLNDIASVSSDDYIAFLEDGLGDWPVTTAGQISHKMNIGVGRFPVNTLEEARVMVDKVIHYEKKQLQFGDWLNRITFVADDGDSNTHIEDADIAARIATRENPGIDIQKIYIDAFPEVPSPSGAVTEAGQNALDRAIQNGTLIVNYSGHGGEVGWTEEQVLRLDQIYKWENYDKLTFFFTATCEFGRYDDPEFVSGGELVLHVNNGGAVGIMTTTRAVFANANEKLNIAFYDNLFDRKDGRVLTCGEIIRRTKNQSIDTNNRSFALLGDPSMRMNIPDKKVLISEINTVDPSIAQDTLKALCLVNLKGKITNSDSSLISNFNGFVDLKVYDKELELLTLGNQNAKYPYTQYKNYLFKGKASVIDGEFQVQFIVPKDIDYSIGRGKITAYAYDTDRIQDANGYEERFYVGSTCEGVDEDNDPPAITIYLDDTTFISGDVTSSSPELIAFLSDENGINFTGTGIGHDITADVSAMNGEKIILNDYYLSDLNTYQTGSLRYRLKDLPEGSHILELKAWDTHNNSSEESVQFIVASSEEVVIRNLMNYPNPFTDVTYFSLDHNKAEQNVEIKIRVFDRMGKLVKDGSFRVAESSGRIDGKSITEFSWDGSDQNGDKLSGGLYTFEVQINSEDGTAGRELRRLVYIK